MSDKQFYQKQFEKHTADAATFKALATMTTDPEAREFYQRQADRAKAYADDYAKDLAK